MPLSLGTPLTNLLTRSRLDSVYRLDPLRLSQIESNCCLNIQIETISVLDGPLQVEAVTRRQNPRDIKSEQKIKICYKHGAAFRENCVTSFTICIAKKCSPDCLTNNEAPCTYIHPHISWIVELTQAIVVAFRRSRRGSRSKVHAQPRD